MEENKVCLDYFKVVFNYPFNDGYEFEELFKILGYKVKDHDSKGQTKNFTDRWVFGEHIEFMPSGKECTLTKDDNVISILELKGQGCREFEFNGGDWILLFKQILKMKGEFRRIDIATDMFTNLITKDDLYFKCKNHEYTTRCKKLEFTSDNIESCDFEMSGKNFNEKFVIKIGSQKSRQLCVYDKVAERKANAGIDLLNLSWLRFELRFNYDNAIGVGPLILDSLINDEFPKLAAGLLKDFIEFKESRGSHNNTYKLKIWDKRDKFLGDVSKIKYQRKSLIDSTIESNKAWIDKSVNKSLARVVLSKFDLEASYFYLVKEINKGFSKFNKQDLSVINNSRKLGNLDPLTYEQLEEFIARLNGEVI